MRLVIGLGWAALALAGCARDPAPTLPPAPPIAIEGDSIRYETSPCYGRCPVYAVTVRPDGTGIFEGKKFTAVEGTRAFELSAAEYKAFADKLQPYRPETGTRRIAPGEISCGQAATDLPSVEVTWTRAIGDSQGLYYYFGCRGDGGTRNHGLADALGAAAEELPIEELIGERP
ncbi:MAG: hypothetical protein EOP62_08475 [Sphingomonadales bacterium]|nr:MAG: hypothetical protein EOP62_08475 [Sphingomonadales bacterium]